MSSGSPHRLIEGRTPLSLPKNINGYQNRYGSKCANNSNGISIFKRTTSPVTFNGNKIFNSVSVAKPQSMRARSPLFLFSTLKATKSTGCQVIRPSASYAKSKESCLNFICPRHIQFVNNIL